ncbi:MAG: hypothetical protein WCX65_07755 [bacterium]
MKTYSIAAFCLILPVLFFSTAAPAQTSAQSGSATPAAATATVPAPVLTQFNYPYRSEPFNIFVIESYTVNRKGDPQAFYAWMSDAYEKSNLKYPGKESLPLDEFLNEQQRELAAMADVTAKTKAELELAAWLHKLIKKVIPKFSLETGFEFCNTAACGERQCFLQSVLIAGLLQSMGVDGGTVMVYKNIRGEASNNGHAAVLVKLPDSRDVIVDASDPEPFQRQQGLFAFLYEGQYIFADPVYENDAPTIIGYVAPWGGRPIERQRIRTMGNAFISSQFWYYRGERAPGGIFAPKKTGQGLSMSKNYLQTSVNLCPWNPLAVYMLGRVYWAEGDRKGARPLFERAAVLYEKYGMLPAGPDEYLKLSRSKKRKQ